MTRAASLALLGLLALAPAAARGSEADAFENRVKPISGQLYQKAGRFELSPGAEISLNDAFFQKFLFGGKLTYHFTEWLSLSGSGAVGPSRATGSTLVCPPNDACRPATEAQLAAVPGEILMKAGGEIGFSPVYAKLNLLAEKAIHFDLSLLLGADWISYREILPPPTSPGVAVDPGKVSAIGGHVGLGTRVFLSEWAALRVEVKDCVYRVDVAGNTRWQQQLFVETGLSFFVPFHNRRGP